MTTDTDPQAGNLSESAGNPPMIPAGSRSPWLERITAVVLLAVVLSLGWTVMVAHQPQWLRLPSLELEITVVLGLLSAALLLVSVVALLHTRS